MTDPITIEVGTFPTPFRFVFKHTSAARAASANVIVRATDAAVDADEQTIAGYGEGCPREYVTGETVEGAIQYLRGIVDDLGATVDDIGQLRVWIDANREVIDQNPAAFCSLELALLDLFARRSGQSIDALLGLPELAGDFRYSAVLGDSHPATFAAQLLRYQAGRVRDYKIKLSGDLDRDRSRARWFRGRIGRVLSDSVRVDANNLWTDPDEASAHLRATGMDLLGVEEPLRAGDLDGFVAIAQGVGTKIILDESLLRRRQIGDLPGDPARWILNCRISKSGGLIRSLELIEAAKAAGLGVIVGAHVGETSLLTRAALTAATAAGPSLLAQEGAFGTNLLATDICDDPIMFGRGGLLPARRVAAIGSLGLGVDVIEGRLDFPEQRRPPARRRQHRN
jgi:L-alanine-DL-glutamate epimerase-like enolase superfamily enzyme